MLTLHSLKKVIFKATVEGTQLCPLFLSTAVFLATTLATDIVKLHQFTHLSIIIIIIFLLIDLIICKLLLQLLLLLVLLVLLIFEGFEYCINFVVVWLGSLHIVTTITITNIIIIII
jgi:hypothetical protein